MRFPDGLDGVLQTGSSVRVLRALVGLPRGMSASARDIARRAGVSHPTASTLLADLLAVGIAEVQRTAAANAFAYNDDHILADHIRHLFERERSAADALVETLRRAVEIKGVSAAFVFGSFARGESTDDSDIDVAVICTPDAEPAVNAALVALDDELRRRFGNALNAIVETEGSQRRPGTRRLWRSVIKEGIPILDEVGAGGSAT